MTAAQVAAFDPVVLHFPKSHWIRTRDACVIAGIDRLLLNDCVSRGLCPDVPKAVKGGAPRQFRFEDVVHLKIVGDLLAIGFGARAAFEMARAVLRGDGEWSDNSGTLSIKFDLHQLRRDLTDKFLARLPSTLRSAGGRT